MADSCIFNTGEPSVYPLAARLTITIRLGVFAGSCLRETWIFFNDDADLQIGLGQILNLTPQAERVRQLLIANTLLPVKLIFGNKSKVLLSQRDFLSLTRANLEATLGVV